MLYDLFILCIWGELAAHYDENNCLNAWLLRHVMSILKGSIGLIRVVQALFMYYDAMMIMDALTRAEPRQ